MRKHFLLGLVGLLLVSLVGCQQADEEVEVRVVKRKRKPDETPVVAQVSPTANSNGGAQTDDGKSAAKPAATGDVEIVKPIGFGGPKRDDTPRTQKSVLDPTAMAYSGNDSMGGPIGPVANDIRESVKIRKTLAIWVIDEDADNSIRGDIVGRIGNAYSSFDKEGSGNLMSAVVGGGSEVEFLTPNATADVGAVQAALNKAASTKGESKLFAAVAAAADKFMGLAAQDKRDVFLVVISQNGGGDLDKLEAAIDALKKYPPNTLSFYAITHSTPLGATGNRFSKEPSKFASATLYPESIAIEQWQGGKTESDFSSSGFGPWSLGRMASAMKPGSVVLADGGSSPEIKAMEKFKPDYVSAKEYDRLMSENKARKALHEAARLARVQVMAGAKQLSFTRPDGSNSNAQANFVTMISKVQRDSSFVLKDLERMSEILLNAEADSKNLPPRLKVEYSLALAKVLLNRARADGYDSLLAAIKQGKPFKDAAHKTWSIEPDFECKELSNIDGWCKKSRKHLESIVNDAPGTPWAEMAAAELEKHYGWKIMEQ